MEMFQINSLGKLRTKTTWKIPHYSESYYEEGFDDHLVHAAEYICYKDHNILVDYHKLPETTKGESKLHRQL